LGTFGDAGIVSFGNGKICFGTGGGGLVSRQPDVLARARAISAPPEELVYTLRQAAGIMLWRCWRRWSLPLYVAIFRLRGSNDRPVYRRRAMANLAAAVAASLMDTLDANLAARRVRVGPFVAASEADYRCCLTMRVPRV
jgi:dTDP-4-amino-4,6-dideoxygalactose transaminase